MAMTRRSYGLLALAAVVALTAVLLPGTDPVEAQSNGSPVLTFVRFDGIEGEATATGFEGWSVVDSINTSVFRDDMVGSTRARNRAVFEDLVLVKPLDAAGPYLQRAAWTGRVFDSVEIDIVRATGDQQTVYWEIEMTNVVIGSYTMGTTGQAEFTENDLPLIATSMAPTEQVTLKFEKAKVRYVEQNEDGSAGDEHEVEFDITAGK